jgi:hypothetical protein
MCTTMSNIMLQSFGLLVALMNFIWFFYTKLWYKWQSFTSAQGHGHLPTFRLHKKYSYCHVLSPCKVITRCSHLRRNDRTIDSALSFRAIELTTESSTISAWCADWSNDWKKKPEARFAGFLKLLIFQKGLCWSFQTNEV